MIPLLSYIQTTYHPIHEKYIITLESHPLVKVTNNLIHLAIFSSSWELMQYNSLKHHNNPIATKL